MLTAPKSSPTRITSSPSLSPQTHPSTSQQPPIPPFMQTIHDEGEPATMPHDSSQPRVQSLGSDKGSLTLNELTLILRVKKLEHKVKASKSRRRTKIVVSDDEEVSEDPSKQGRIIGRTSADTEILLDQEELTELVKDPGSGKKGKKEISTAEVPVSTASAIHVVSTAILERQVYIRRSVEKRKDKGKAIMEDDEFVQKKTKKQLEQERLGHEEAIRLQEQINKEERQRISKDAKIAKQLQEEIDIATKEGMAETTQAHDIDWSNPAVLRYHAQQNRSFSKAEVRKNMCIVWDQNQSFVPKDSEIKKEVMKRTGFDFQKPPAKRQKMGEGLESVEEQSAGKEKEVSEEEII
ncbi:hypothetical protein Tco_1287150 [Tanacetum coccineum]